MRPSASFSRPLRYPESAEGSPNEVRRAESDTGTFMEPRPSTTPQAASATKAEIEPQPQTNEPQLLPLEFVKEGADARTRVYSARDELGSIYAAFYADGRLRVAFEDHRLAGIVQSGHAHVLDMNTEVWSEVFVRVTPDGALQLELRDGPLDGRVFTCEALQA